MSGDDAVRSQLEQIAGLLFFPAESRERADVSVTLGLPSEDTALRRHALDVLGSSGLSLIDMEAAAVALMKAYLGGIIVSGLHSATLTETRDLDIAGFATGLGLGSLADVVREHLPEMKSPLALARARAGRVMADESIAGFTGQRADEVTYWWGKGISLLRVGQEIEWSAAGLEVPLGRTGLSAFGESGKGRLTDTPLRIIDTGDLRATSLRLLFIGAKSSESIAYADLVDVRRHLDGIALFVSGARSPVAVLIPPDDAELVATTIRIACESAVTAPAAGSAAAISDELDEAMVNARRAALVAADSRYATAFLPIARLVAMERLESDNPSLDPNTIPLNPAIEPAAVEDYRRSAGAIVGYMVTTHGPMTTLDVWQLRGLIPDSIVLQSADTALEAVSRLGALTSEESLLASMKMAHSSFGELHAVELAESAKALARSSHEMSGRPDNGAQALEAFEKRVDLALSAATGRIGPQVSSSQPDSSGRELDRGERAEIDPAVNRARSKVVNDAYMRFARAYRNVAIALAIADRGGPPIGPDAHIGDDPALMKAALDLAVIEATSIVGHVAIADGVISTSEAIFLAGFLPESRIFQASQAIGELRGGAAFDMIADRAGKFTSEDSLQFLLKLAWNDFGEAFAIELADASKALARATYELDGESRTGMDALNAFEQRVDDAVRAAAQTA